MDRHEERHESGPQETRGPTEKPEATGAAQPSESPVGENKVSAQPEPGAAREQRSGEPPASPGEPAETAGAEQPTEGQAPEQPEIEAGRGERPEGQPGYVRIAAVSAGVLMFALAFFMSGFAVHALLDEDGGGDGGGELTTGSAADDPAWGPEDAAVTIVEYADYQCPYCARHAQQTIPRLRQAYGDKVRYVYRDFPIAGSHPFAQKAAEAAQCAHDQGLSWEYHDVLFADQSALSVPDLKISAELVGADMDEFNECLDSGENAWEVWLDMQDGQRAGVTGTPAFLINGMLVSGAQPFETFQAIVEQALAAAK